RRSGARRALRVSVQLSQSPLGVSESVRLLLSRRRARLAGFVERQGLPRAAGGVRGAVYLGRGTDPRGELCAVYAGCGFARTTLGDGEDAWAVRSGDRDHGDGIGAARRHRGAARGTAAPEGRDAFPAPGLAVQQPAVRGGT